MKRVALSLLLSLLLLTPSIAADEWPIQRVSQSLVHLLVDNPETGAKGKCTAFSVDAQKGLYLTASHCATGEMANGDMVFSVVEVAEDTDLALIHAEGTLPALPISEPKEGDSYLGIGYSSGLTRPMYFPMTYQGEFVVPGGEKPDSIFVGSAMGGTSGGPIIDRKGAAVSVITAGGRPGSMVQDITFGTLYRAMFRLVMKHR